MRPEDFQARFSVSRESIEKLKQYQGLLEKWQRAINLVGPSTLPYVWARHFADSAQLNAKIPSNIKCLVDLGSGAGFPGLVLAMIRPELKVHLVESDERKAQFLRTVSRETGAPVTVHNARIEDVTGGIAPDLVTARALASLSELLTYVTPWAMQNPNLEALFLKGKGADDEVQQALKSFNFTCESTVSMTEKEARILALKQIRVAA